MRFINGIILKIFHLYQLLLVKSINTVVPLRAIARNTPFHDIRQLAWKKTGIIFGDKTYINHSITILDGNDTKLIIGNRVALSPNITFVLYSSPNDSIMMKDMIYKRYIKSADIFIDDDTWIGANVVVQPGIKIGKRCIIGSCSNVTKDIPDDYLAYGNPAKLIKKLI